MRVLFGIVSFVAVLIVSIFLWYQFVKNCEDYLKLAGDSPNIEMADQFLGMAIDYMEKNNLTSGNSSLIFNTPGNDVGIWYKKIKGAKKTTETMLNKIKDDPASVTQLEQDNALMKIREVVLDNSKKGTEVTLPEGVDWHPYRRFMLFWWFLSVFILIWGIRDTKN